MTAREWLNVLAILNSIDEVPGMPAFAASAGYERVKQFVGDPVRFFQKANASTQAAIWAEVERRLAGGA